MDLILTLENLTKAFEQIKQLNKYYPESHSDLKLLKKAWTQLNSVFLSTEFDNDFALKLYKSALFSSLDDELKAMFAIKHWEIAFALLDNLQLEKFQSKWLNKLIMGFVMGLSFDLKCGENYVYDSFQGIAIDMTARELFCLNVAKQPSIVNKLSPTAQIFLFTFVKNSKLFSENQHALDILFRNKINNAYDIETNYNRDEIGAWDKYLLPSLAGNFGCGDYIYRVTELIHKALYDEAIDPRHPKDAIAEILVAERCFDDYFAQQMRLRNSYQYRLQLGLKFPKVAELLIQYPEYRGTHENEITQKDLNQLIDTHKIEIRTIFKDLQNQDKSLLKQLSMINSKSQTIYSQSSHSLFVFNFSSENSGGTDLVTTQLEEMTL